MDKIISGASANLIFLYFSRQGRSDRPRQQSIIRGRFISETTQIQCFGTYVLKRICSNAQERRAVRPDRNVYTPRIKILSPQHDLDETRVLHSVAMIDRKPATCGELLDRRASCPGFVRPGQSVKFTTCASAQNASATGCNSDKWLRTVDLARISYPHLAHLSFHWRLSCSTSGEAALP